MTEERKGTVKDFWEGFFKRTVRSVRSFVKMTVTRSKGFTGEETEEEQISHR